MSAFVTHLWTSTIFLAAAMLAARFLPLTARTRYVLLLAGIFKFAVPPLPLIGIELQRPAGSIAMQWLAGPVQLAAAPAAPASTFDWRLAFAIVWIASAAILALAWAIARRRLVHSALAATTVASPRERRALTAARHALRLRTSIDIRRAGVCEAPAVVRVIRPVVVLRDGGCDMLDDAELESLLRHECAHVARRDNLIGLAESAVVAAFWFHPLVWLAHRAVAAAREEACDEMASAGSSSVDTYVSALTKFCSALVAPRLSGVSCMASAHLKERLNHLMSYESLRQRALPHRFVTAFAALAIVFIAAGSGLVAAPSNDSSDRYRLYWSVRPGESPDHWTFRSTVVDTKTSIILAEPSLEFRRGSKAQLQTRAESTDGERAVNIDIRDAGGKIDVELRVLENGAPVQVSTYSAAPQPDKVSRNASGRRYTGAPLSMNLKDADIKDVLKQFEKMTGLKMQYSADLSGTVTVNVTEMPWDEAFDLILRQNNLTYELQGNTAIIK